MKLVNPAVVGDGWRLLGHHEVLQAGDQSGCASLLMSLDCFEPWREVDSMAVGETVAAWLKDDGDAKERVFRRCMRRDPQALVTEFHAKMGLPVASEPTVGTPEQRCLRVRLMLEELLEFAEAAGIEIVVGDAAQAVALDLKPGTEIQITAEHDPDLARMTHEHIDHQYVVAGTTVELGLPVREGLPLIHEANMRKEPGNKDAGGKIRKPEGWTPADVSGLLKK